MEPYSLAIPDEIRDVIKPINDVVSATITVTQITPKIYKLQRLRSSIDLTISNPPVNEPVSVDIQIPFAIDSSAKKLYFAPFRFEFLFCEGSKTIQGVHPSLKSEFSARGTTPGRHPSKVSIEKLVSQGSHRSNISNTTGTLKSSSSSNQLALKSPQNYGKIYRTYINWALVYFNEVHTRIDKQLESIGGKSVKHVGQIITCLKFLKEEYEKLVKSFQELQHEDFEITTQDFKNSSQLAELNKCIANIIAHYKEKLTLTKIGTHLADDIEIEQEDLVCSVLGLNESVVEYLLRIDKEMRSHKHDKYWIGLYLESQNIDKNSGNHWTNFLTLGFTAERAQYLSNKLKPHSLQDHKNCLQWALIYIDHLFQYDTLLRTNEDTCPLINEAGKKYTFISNVESPESKLFFASNVEPTELKDGSNEPTKHIEAIELNGDFIRKFNGDFQKGYRDFKSHPDIQKYVPKQDKPLKGVSYWFHATDKDSAWNIVTEGIDLEYGKTGADFSYHNAFYLSTDLDLAVEWLRNKPWMTKNRAIIVFEVDNSDKIFPEREGKRFAEADVEWKNCIARYRDMVKGIGWKKREKSIKYIYGPLSKDGSKAQYGEDHEPRPREPIGFQLCVKDDLLSDIFYWASSIFVIFLN